jgi:hypothetical protein
MHGTMLRQESYLSTKVQAQPETRLIGLNYIESDQIRSDPISRSIEIGIQIPLFRPATLSAIWVR